MVGLAGIGGESGMCVDSVLSGMSIVVVLVEGVDWSWMACKSFSISRRFVDLVVGFIV